MFLNPAFKLMVEKLRKIYSWEKKSNFTYSSICSYFLKYNPKLKVFSLLTLNIFFIFAEIGATK